MVDGGWCYNPLVGFYLYCWGSLILVNFVLSDSMFHGFVIPFSGGLVMASFGAFSESKHSTTA